MKKISMSTAVRMSGAISDDQTFPTAELLQAAKVLKRSQSTLHRPVCLRMASLLEAQAAKQS